MQQVSTYLLIYITILLHAKLATLILIATYKHSWSGSSWLNSSAETRKVLPCYVSIAKPHAFTIENICEEFYIAREPFKDQKRSSC